MGLVWYYAETNPVMSRLGRTPLDRIQSADQPLRQPLRVEGVERHPVPFLKLRVVDGLVRDREPTVPRPGLQDNARNLTAGEIRRKCGPPDARRPGSRSLRSEPW